MEPLFDAKDVEQPERKEQSMTTRETLERLEERRTALFHDLAGLAEEQKRLVSEIRRGEKEQKELLDLGEEHIAEEPLTHEDVVRWVESVHAQFARTMPANPHAYIHTRWTDRPMFERVVRHIREHGYKQRYGSSDYICYDAGDRFFWTMGSPLEDTILINCKPLSMKPDQA